MHLQIISLFVSSANQAGEVWEAGSGCGAGEQLSLVTRKPVFGVCDQVRHKPACATTEAT